MEEYIGIIKLFAGNRCPTGFAFCEGQVLSIQQFTALFSIIGTNYGGDGITNFHLPDLRPKKDVYTLQNTSVRRAHESDPGTIGYLEDGTALFKYSMPPNPSEGWGDNPRYIICIEGVYPPFD